jgi:hypothetical protein
MLRANDGGGDSGLIRWRRGDMFASSDIIVIGRSYELEARSYSCLGVIIRHVVSRDWLLRFW